MKTIFAISGRAGAGKDTLANMLGFLYSNYVVDPEEYAHWYEYQNEAYLRITHFADSLKNIVARSYNLPLFYLNDRRYKDELYFNLTNHFFVVGNKISIKDSIINIEQLQKYSLRELIEHNNKSGFSSYIKLRTLLQYFGTEIYRKQIDEHIWTNITIDIVNDMLKNVNDCYIADMRFKEEFDRITAYAKQANVKLVTIHINRPNNDNEIPNNHSSEQQSFNCTYTIDNDGTLKDLFEKAKEIYHENC